MLPGGSTFRRDRARYRAEMRPSPAPPARGRDYSSGSVAGAIERSRSVYSGRGSRATATR